MNASGATCWPNFQLVLVAPPSVQTSQELRMLSSITLNCQVTKIVMDLGSQLSVSQMSQVSRIVIVIVQWSKLSKMVKIVKTVKNG